MSFDPIYSASLTIIIVHSEIFRPIREWILNRSSKLGYLVQCPMCLGVWIGGIWAAIFGGDILLQSLLTSLLSWIIYSVVTAFGAVGDYFTENLASNNLGEESKNEEDIND